jgi:hypothetical protein
VYDTLSGELLQELRRGADRAEIYSIAFNAGSTMLACTSDKGTVHIFRLKECVHDATPVASAGLSGPSALLGGAAAGGAAAGAGRPSGAGGDSGGTGSSGGGGGAGGASAGAAAGGAGGGGAHGSGAEAGAASSRDGGHAGGDEHAGGSGEAPSHGGAAPTHGGAGGPAAGGKEGGGGGKDKESGNAKSSFSFMKGLLPKYFSSEWSFAQFRVPETRSLVAFGQEPHTIIVVGADGSFFKANYEKGGEAVRVAMSVFVSGGGGV